MADRLQTRERDEMHLEWLRLREEKVSCSQIAKKYSVTKNAVIGACNRIYHDDWNAEQGENYENG